MHLIRRHFDSNRVLLRLPLSTEQVFGYMPHTDNILFSPWTSNTCISAILSKENISICVNSRNRAHLPGERITGI